MHLRCLSPHCCLLVVCLFVCFLPNVFSYDGRLGVELAKDMPVHKFEQESGYDE